MSLEGKWLKDAVHHLVVLFVYVASDVDGEAILEVGLAHLLKGILAIGIEGIVKLDVREIPKLDIRLAALPE